MKPAITLFAILLLAELHADVALPLAPVEVPDSKPAPSKKMPIDDSAKMLEKPLLPRDAAVPDEDAAGRAVDAARALVARVLQGYADKFSIEIISSDHGKDVFEIDNAGSKVVLRGNNPVSVASALNWYLKHYAKCHLSWCGDNLSNPLPAVPMKERIVNPRRYRVYLNYCTLSYTATWWDWKRWEREIDFMAMNGINMPLSVIGIEGAWYHTLLRVGFTDAEAREFLVGPAYQAWQWMQNIEGYGGPLPKSWIDSHIKLGRQILDRQRELGMTPIQQGFSGAVPRLLKQKFPQAAMKQQPRWCNFTGIMQLDPLDPLFTKIGGIFLEEQKRLFSTSHFYGCDPFHESGPPRSEPGYLEQVGKSIGDLLVKHDPNAVWCMQSWSLRKQILTAMPKERMLVLDLDGRWKSSDGFWGYPFVAGVIHNFGGRTRMAGDLAALAKNPFSEALAKGNNCQGMGLFPEAIEQNPVYYDLVFDLIWRNSGVEVGPWVRDYVRRRYGTESGSAEKAWEILLRTVYKTVTPSSVFVTRPVLDLKKCDPNNGVSMTYDPAEFFKAWELLLADADRLKGSAGYRYDVVDLGRQVMGDLAHPMHWAVANAFLDRNTNKFVRASRQFLELFTDADTLCSTEPGFSHRRWIRSAQAWATTPEERTLYIFNANMLLTQWGGDPLPDIFDYAWREWGGLLGDYYRGRWEKFHVMLSDRMARGESWSESGFKLNYNRPAVNAEPFYNELYDWETNWIRSDKSYSADSVGDPIPIARAMMDKYRPVADALFSAEGRKVWTARQNRVKEARLSKELGDRVWSWNPDTLAAD